MMKFKNTSKKLGKVTNLLVKGLKSQLRLQEYYATGKLSRSFAGTISKAKDLVLDVTSSKHYWRVVNDPRVAFSVNKQNIIRWMNTKGLDKKYAMQIYSRLKSGIYANRKANGKEDYVYWQHGNTLTRSIVVQVVVKGGKQLDNLDKKTGKATKSVGGLTKGMAKMAGGVALAAAAFRGISKVVSSAISTFKDFEFQMAKVKAVSGASSLDFQKLSQSAEELGRSTFFTATQVAELQTNYAKLGFTTKEILQAQEATLLLATATGSDLARAAIVAGAAVRGFGLDASETGRVTDVMTLAFASSALDIEKWQTSMTKVAPIAESMNIPLENTAAIMGALTDAGIEASIAGTSMRNIFLKMKDPTSKLSKFLGFTVNSADDLTKAMDKLQTAGDKTLDREVTRCRRSSKKNVRYYW